MPLTVDPGTLDALRSLRGEMQELMREQEQALRQRAELSRQLQERSDQERLGARMASDYERRAIIERRTQERLGGTWARQLDAAEERRVMRSFEQRVKEEKLARQWSIEIQDELDQKGITAKHVRKAIDTDPGLSHLSPTSLRRSIMGTVHAYEMLREGRVSPHMAHVPAHAMELAGNLASTAGATGLGARLSRYAGFLGGPAVGGALLGGVLLAEKWQEFQKAQEDTLKQSRQTRKMLWELEAVRTGVGEGRAPVGDQGRALREMQERIGRSIKERGEWVFGEAGAMPETAKRLKALGQAVGTEDYGEKLPAFQALERGAGFAAQIISQASKDFRTYALARQQVLGAEVRKEGALRGTLARTPVEIQNELLGMLEQEGGVERLAAIGKKMKAMAEAPKRPEAVVLKERAEERRRDLETQAVFHERRLRQQDWTTY